MCSVMVQGCIESPCVVGYLSDQQWMSVFLFIQVALLKLHAEKGKESIGHVWVIAPPCWSLHTHS